MDISGLKGNLGNLQRKQSVESNQKAAENRRKSVSTEADSNDRVSKVRDAGRKQQVNDSSSTSENNAAPRARPQQGGISGGLAREISRQLANQQPKRPTQAPKVNEQPKPEAKAPEAPKPEKSNSEQIETQAKAREIQPTRDGGVKKRLDF